MSRGGAGNIEARELAQAESQAQAQSSSHNYDLEAAAGYSPTHSSTSTNAQPSIRQQTYAHTGRGGAGNWYEPRKAAQTGTFDTPYAIDAKRGQPAQGEMSAWAGRGGAGNFEPRTRTGSAGAEMSAEAVEATRRAEADVEAGLVRPEKAFLGGKERVDDGFGGGETGGMEMTGVVS